MHKKPRRGVCSIAAILEDHEEVVDVVLLLVVGQPRLLQLHLLEVELLVVRLVRRGVLEREAPREGRRSTRRASCARARASSTIKSTMPSARTFWRSRTS